MKILPRTQTPDLTVETVDRGPWKLSEQKPQNFTLLIVYRGHHCPLCKRQLQEYDRFAGDFAKLGVELFAVSSNDRELAERAVREWEIENLSVGYGLSLEEAKDWGMFVSSAAKDTEPAQFTEPGLFIIRPDRTLYASSIQTMPFSRAAARQLLGTLEFVIEKDYPARGEAG